MWQKDEEDEEEDDEEDEDEDDEEEDEDEECDPGEASGEEAGEEEEEEEEEEDVEEEEDDEEEEEPTPLVKLSSCNVTSGEGSPAKASWRRRSSKGTKCKIKVGPVPGAVASRRQVNVSCCMYRLVKKCVKRQGWVSSSANSGWDLFWSDTDAVFKKGFRFNKIQCTNHFPGMSDICRKDFLAFNLNIMRRQFPDQFDFYPRSWLLPGELGALQSHMRDTKKAARKVLIVKPARRAQGKGIYLVACTANGVGRLPKKKGCFVVQEYIDRPLLIDNFKFDLRVYVLVLAVDPLVVYIHRDGLARLATSSYERPKQSNLRSRCMHLTNYAVNKKSKQFDKSECEGEGSKRSISSVMRMLESSGEPSEPIWRRLCQVVLKTIITISPMLVHKYRAHFLLPPSNGKLADSHCFEILGFDLMLDADLQVHLIEVNQAPSFTCGSELDTRIKSSVVQGAFELCGLNQRRKKQWLDQQRTWQSKLFSLKAPANKKLLARRRSSLPDDTSRTRPVVHSRQSATPSPSPSPSPSLSPSKPPASPAKQPGRLSAGMIARLNSSKLSGLAPKMSDLMPGWEMRPKKRSTPRLSALRVCGSNQSYSASYNATSLPEPRCSSVAETLPIRVVHPRPASSKLRLKPRPPSAQSVDRPRLVRPQTAGSAPKGAAPEQPEAVVEPVELGLPALHGEYELIYPTGGQSELNELLQAAQMCVQSVTKTSTAAIARREEATRRQKEQHLQDKKLHRPMRI